MKQTLTLFLALFFSWSLNAQSVEQSLSEKVKVVFPGKPELTELAQGPKVYSFKKDSSIAFMAMTLDLSPMGLTEDLIASTGDALWDQLKGGMMGQLAGASLVKDEIITFKGKSSLYIEIDGSTSTTPMLKGKKAFGYLFFSGAVLHQILFYSANPAAKKEDGAYYFDSVVITK